jgi:hypothetical protein
MTSCRLSLLRDHKDLLIITALHSTLPLQYGNTRFWYRRFSPTTPPNRHVRAHISLDLADDSGSHAPCCKSAQNGATCSGSLENQFGESRHLSPERAQETARLCKNRSPPVTFPHLYLVFCSLALSLALFSSLFPFITHSLNVCCTPNLFFLFLYHLVCPFSLVFLPIGSIRDAYTLNCVCSNCLCVGVEFSIQNAHISWRLPRVM